jgi:hypothetical protein
MYHVSMGNEISAVEFKRELLRANRMVIIFGIFGCMFLVVCAFAYVILCSGGASAHTTNYSLFFKLLN